MLAAFASLLLAAADPPDDRFVILARKSDEIEVLPLASIRTLGDHKTLTVVSIYAAEDESESRMDSEMEIDCARQQFRGLRVAKYWYFKGKETPSERPLPETEKAWQPMMLSAPLIGALHAVVCENTDITPYARHDLQRSLPSLRADLQP